MAHRLVWATDTHFDHARDGWMERFAEQARSLCADTLLITGDVSDAAHVFDHLKELSALLPGVRIFFVLGNHDYYGASIAMVRKYAADDFPKEPGAESAAWLGASGPVMLGDRTALVGDDGWYDGRNGNFFRSDIELNDFHHIAELTTPNRQERLRLIKELADASADRIERLIGEAAAMPGVEKIIVATHVPPWPGAAWHMGRTSDNSWQPFMSSRSVGLAIEKAAGQTDKEFLVLCGHSHSPGVHRPSQQITCETGQAQYGRPSVFKWFDL